MTELIGWLLMVFVGGGSVLLSLAFICYIAGEIDHKIGNWLTDRKLRKKFGDKWDQ